MNYEALFESLVMNYLATEGLFLSPQFSVSEENGEWSCPDFVALNFRAREIQVIEVSTAYNIRALFEKIENREEKWFCKLIPQLLARGIPVADWTAVVRVFIRRDRHDFMRAKFGQCPDVRIEVLEDMAFRWQWPWEQWS